MNSQLTYEWVSIPGTAQLGRVLRRYVNGRLQAERGWDYSLGEPPISEVEHSAEAMPQNDFLALMAAGPGDRAHAANKYPQSATANEPNLTEREQKLIADIDKAIRQLARAVLSRITELEDERDEALKVRDLAREAATRYKEERDSANATLRRLGWSATADFADKSNS